MASMMPADTIGVDLELKAFGLHFCTVELDDYSRPRGSRRLVLLLRGTGQSEL